MNASLVFTLLAASLTVVLLVVLALWRREARRLAAAGAGAAAREREAAASLAASEARLEAALQAARTERELRERSEEQVRVLTDARARVEAELAAVRASSETEIAALRQRNAEEREAERARREKEEQAMRLQFRSLADEIMDEQSRRFKQTNKESLDILLKPFRDNITEFRERVERIYSAENEQRGALKNELRNLMELNRRITAETTNLTNALRGNSKVQGDWGEMILETILDGSNLIKGVHYHTQVNLRDETGSNLRPDVVLHLPENKRIVIDSKVSLTAYVNYVGSQDEEERRRQLAAHVQSVRQHVAELGRKEYQRLLESPDFVIMFVPNAPAFLAAMQSDSAIWSDAYERKVIVSSPTNLFALLKLVDDLWKRNAQSKNTADIVTYGTKLYEQLVAFTASLEGVGQSLDQARERYGDAYKRLTSGNDNIVRCGERLRKLGLPTKRRQSPRVLEAASAYDEADDASTPADAVPPADTVSQ